MADGEQFEELLGHRLLFCNGLRVSIYVIFLYYCQKGVRTNLHSITQCIHLSFRNHYYNVLVTIPTRQDAHLEDYNDDCRSNLDKAIENFRGTYPRIKLSITISLIGMSYHKTIVTRRCFHLLTLESNVNDNYR